jgi:hypothetical protein
MCQSQPSARAPIHNHELDCDAFLDPGIAKAVKILNKFGIQTYESCQGGAGHSYPEPTGPAWEMVFYAPRPNLA